MGIFNYGSEVSLINLLTWYAEMIGEEVIFSRKEGIKVGPYRWYQGTKLTDKDLLNFLTYLRDEITAIGKYRPDNNKQVSYSYSEEELFELVKKARDAFQGPELQDRISDDEVKEFVDKLKNSKK